MKEKILFLKKILEKNEQEFMFLNSYGANISIELFEPYVDTNKRVLEFGVSDTLEIEDIEIKENEIIINKVFVIHLT